MLQVELLRDGGKAWWKPSSHDARSRFAVQPCIRYGPLLSPETLTEMHKIRFKITKARRALTRTLNPNRAPHGGDVMHTPFK